MPRKTKELSATEVRRLSAPGRHAVGGVPGLMLQISPNGAKSWLLRVMVAGKRRDLGLGGFPAVTMAAAREKARAMREQIAQGVDPVVERQAAKSALARELSKATTFEQLARDYIDRKSREYKTIKQTQRLTNMLESYGFPYIGGLLVADIEMAHIVAMLQPIWGTKTATATRLRLHVEKVLDAAIADGKREGSNPARWKGMLEHSTLPAPGKIAKTQHLAALPVDEMPGFWKKLDGLTGMGACVLRFIILTGCRSSEGRAASWDEIDLAKRTWTIPGERMKTGKPHVVPLSDEALALLDAVPRLGPYVFTGARGGTISDSMVSRIPKRLGWDVTAHGFRSVLKDWARRYTGFADEVSELALAHVNDDRTRAAYARDGLIDKRRLLIRDWAEFCVNGQNVVGQDKVISIGGHNG